jgi:hypothetical protein
VDKPSRRHHYLPQFYLRGFGDEEERLWVFDRETVSLRHQGTANIALEKDFYTVTTSDGQRSDQIEKVLSPVEGDSKRIIDRLDGRVSALEAEDRSILALFMGLMRNRTPAFDKDQSDFTEQFLRWRYKAGHPNAEAVAEGFREYEAATGESMSGVSPDDVFNTIREDQFEIKNPRQNNIKLMLDLALPMAQALIGLNWNVVWTPKEFSFVTCDNPLTVVPPPNFVGGPQGYGILTPEATTIIPLSRKTGIYFLGEGGNVRYAVAKKDFVRQTNYVVAANSERFVLAREKLLLENVVRKTRLGDWQRPPSLQFHAPDPYSKRQH